MNYLTPLNLNHFFSLQMVATNIYFESDSMEKLKKSQQGTALGEKVAGL